MKLDISNTIYITELISKGTLKSIINSEKSGIADPKWDYTQKLITLYGISAAMSFLHAHNIIHRDLKTDNIIESAFSLVENAIEESVPLLQLSKEQL